jgi:hypothetical protein
METELTEDMQNDWNIHNDHAGDSMDYEADTWQTEAEYDYFNEIEQGRYDDDPSPYAGDYSED